MASHKDIVLAAAQLGARGGKKAAAGMTPEQRAARARNAALRRWEAVRLEREKLKRS